VVGVVLHILSSTKSNVAESDKADDSVEPLVCWHSVVKQALPDSGASIFLKKSGQVLDLDDSFPHPFDLLVPDPAE
jgi:hypothetical protein